MHEDGNLLLIVGLGNPGLRYRNTRHNVGFQVVEVLSLRWQIPLTWKSNAAHWGRGTFASREVILAQPETYMNLSGKAVRRLLEHFNLTPNDLLVIHDDLDMPLGKLKFVQRSGAGGHRGVASIINTLGTQEFLRLKVGIGRPRFGEPVEMYVLSPCYSFERELYPVIWERAAAAVEMLLRDGLGRAMSEFHRLLPLTVDLQQEEVQEHDRQSR